MNFVTLLMLGFLPAMVLFAFIYFKDRREPEPAGKLLKAFLFGVLSIPLTLVLCGVIEFIWPNVYSSGSLIGTAYDAFATAAIPEEAAKLVMLMLVLRNNKHFNEKLDGIVYAVCVTLGFAAVENVMYLFGDGDDVLFLAVLRGLLSVPTHFLCGVLMGYFVSLAKFYPKYRNRNMMLAFVVPMLAHGIYDWLLMYGGGDGSSLFSVLFISVLVLCYYMWKVSLRFIREHTQRDLADQYIVQNGDSDAVQE